MDKIKGMPAHLFAQEHCNKGPLNCSWYHGNWYLLKALGIVSTPATHKSSITQLLNHAFVENKPLRILLSGSTDETLLQLAYKIYQALGVGVKFYAVDICATPLAFMASYARTHGIELTTSQSDILKFESSEKFDLILTHAFMGNFDSVQRPLLMEKWARLLTDHGKIVTIQRVRPADSPALVTFTDQQSSQFIAAAIAATKDPKHANKFSAVTVKKVATEFTKKFSSHAITSKIEFESLFIEAGLSFHFLEYQRLAKKGSLLGPSVPSDGEYAVIIAGKKEAIHEPRNA